MVSCAGCHPHERNFLCNHGVCIIHFLQVLPWQTTTSALILQRQHSSFTKCLCRIIMARNGFCLLRHIQWQSGNISEYMPVLFSFKADTSKKYLYKNYFMILLLALLLNIFYKNYGLQSSNLYCP